MIRAIVLVVLRRLRLLFLSAGLCLMPLMTMTGPAFLFGNCRGTDGSTIGKCANRAAQLYEEQRHAQESAQSYIRFVPKHLHQVLGSAKRA